MNAPAPLWGTLTAVAFLAVFQGVGQCLARALLCRRGTGLRLLLGSVLGSVLAHWLPALWAFGLGFGRRAHLAAVVTALALGAGALLLSRKRALALPREEQPFLRRVLSHPFLLVILAFWGFYCLLVWRGFAWEDGVIYSSQATYGDMSMHLSFITSLARQGNFPPMYPLLPGHLLSYPFLSDSISSSLLVAGAPLRWAYCLPMGLAGAQVFLGFWLLARRLGQSRFGAGLAFLLFFGNGGLGFLYFLEDGGLTRLMTSFYQTPTNLTGENIRWVNVIVDMMLPQRATLFGWAVLFAVLCLVLEARRTRELSAFAAAGVLAGALPMIHTHSFLALGLLCAGWMLLDQLPEESPRALKLRRVAILAGVPVMTLAQLLLRRRDLLDAPLLLWLAAGAGGVLALLLAALGVRTARRGEFTARLLPWLVMLGVTLALALPQVLFWTLRQAGEGGFVRGHFGWVIGEDPYPWFYLKNLGLSAVVLLLGLVLARGEDFRRMAPGLLVWFVAELVEFQPNDYDNNKLLYVAFALLLGGSAQCLAARVEVLAARGPRPWLLPVTGALVLGLGLPSAALTWGREWVSRYELFGSGAVALARFVEEETPPEALFLTDTRHNNEIAALAGRSVVCGSPAYLYFHGLPYAQNEAAVRQIYQDPAHALDWLTAFRVRYVLVSDFERHSYAVDEAWFAAHGTPVFHDGVRILYELKGI